MFTGLQLHAGNSFRIITMTNIMIIGATSTIAQAFANLHCTPQHNLYLLGRNTEALTIIKQDLLTRGSNQVEIAEWDALTPSTQANAINKAFHTFGHIDIVLIAHGTLPNQKECESNNQVLSNEIQINGLSTLTSLNTIASKLEEQKSGTIAVITSVAGDRGRQSNYAYGAAKAMVSTYLQGLRNRLFSSQVNVIDIKPGFVDTPMTAEFDKGLLWAQPEAIAKGINKAIKKKKHTVYLPSFWFLIMTVIKSIPENIFKKLKL